MASEFTTKVRLVRCPKCRLVLPELPDFNVYKCGGCGATLQAKNRVNNARSTGSGSNDVDVVHEEREEREEAGSSNKAVLTDSGEWSSSQNNDQMRSKEFNPSSDQFSGSLGDLSKSPTRSSHAYDASISSYDGMDDQFLQRHLHSLEMLIRLQTFYILKNYREERNSQRE